MLEKLLQFGDTIYLFMGVFLAIILQLSTSFVTETAITRRERRDASQRARNSIISFVVDVETILERAGRSNREAEAAYVKAWETTPHATKAIYSTIVKEVDKSFWQLIKQREDKSLSNIKYSQNKLSSFKLITDMLE